MKTKKQGVVAIIQKSDEFLLVKRSDCINGMTGYWCPVSGKIEENETQQEALEREVMEEVGLVVKALRKCCEISSYDNEYDLHFWTTTIVRGKAKVCSNEITDIIWVTVEEMRELSPVFDDDIRIIENLYRESSLS